MKKPEENKKGLETCIGKCIGDKPHCPYHSCGDWCTDKMNRNALAYIRQLEAELEAVKRERDAMERDFLGFAMCENNICNYCNSLTAEMCIRCDDRYPQGFKWRGVCPENTEAQEDG